MKQRDLIKRLKKLGFDFHHHGGSHDIYSNGKIKVQVPRHREIAEKLANKIIKQAGG